MAVSIFKRPLNKEVEQIKSDIGIVENGTTATHNISSGQYVIWQGNLCTALYAILPGDTLSSSNMIAVNNGGLNALNEKIPIAPDWAHPTTGICSVHNVAWTATGNGYILVSKQVDKGMQLNINSVTVFYISPSYYGTSKCHIEWFIPVKKGDEIKLMADTSPLPSDMSAVFYPVRTA